MSTEGNGSVRNVPVSLTDLAEITATSAEFGFLVDCGRAVECEALFLPNARLIFGPGSPKPGIIEGLAAIREFLVNRQAQTQITSRHVATNFRASANGSDTLQCHSLLTLYRSTDESRQPLVASVSDVDEVFRRDRQGRWKFAERKTTPVFA